MRRRRRRRRQHTRLRGRRAFTRGGPPKPSPRPPQQVEQLRRQEAELQTLRAASEKHAADDAASAALAEELKAARAELAALKQARVAEPDTHDYSEAETRDLY